MFFFNKMVILNWTIDKMYLLIIMIRFQDKFSMKSSKEVSQISGGELKH